jgi:hypothetical protein
MSEFDPAEQAKKREEMFPQDRKKTFKMGEKFVKRQKAIK